MTCDLWSLQTCNAGYWYWHAERIRRELAERKAHLARQEADRLALGVALEFQGDEDRVRGVTRECPRGTECV